MVWLSPSLKLQAHPREWWESLSRPSHEQTGLGTGQAEVGGLDPLLRSALY